MLGQIEARRRERFRLIFIPGFRDDLNDLNAACWLLFKGDKILTAEQNGRLTISKVDLIKANIKTIRKQYLGQVDGCPCCVAELDPDTQVPEDMSIHGLRRLLGQVPDDLFNLAGRAYQIMQWDRNYRYCNRCGGLLAPKTDERAKVCPACGLVIYPRISPAIIVAVTRGQEILLARGSRFPAAFYSVLAGFVEPGETFEECVQREIGEEVGLAVNNIRYFGSQPWPFPDSLMVGFTAEYAGGEINIDQKEILDAGWYTAAQMPLIPGTGSIARRLIDQFISKSDRSSASVNLESMVSPG